MRWWRNREVRKQYTPKEKESECDMCMECYTDENRVTPLLNPTDCLEKHTQYICGTCGGVFV